MDNSLIEQLCEPSGNQNIEGTETGFCESPNGARRTDVKGISFPTGVNRNERGITESSLVSLCDSDPGTADNSAAITGTEVFDRESMTGVQNERDRITEYSAEHNVGVTRISKSLTRAMNPNDGFPEAPSEQELYMASGLSIALPTKDLDYHTLPRTKTEEHVTVEVLPVWEFPQCYPDDVPSSREQGFDNQTLDGSVVDAGGAVELINHEQQGFLQDADIFKETPTYANVSNTENEQVTFKENIFKPTESVERNNGGSDADSPEQQNYFTSEEGCVLETDERNERGLLRKPNNGLCPDVFTDCQEMSPNNRDYSESHTLATQGLPPCQDSLLQTEDLWPRLQIAQNSPTAVPHSNDVMVVVTSNQPGVVYPSVKENTAAEVSLASRPQRALLSSSAPRQNPEPGVATSEAENWTQEIGFEDSLDEFRRVPEEPLYADMHSSNDQNAMSLDSVNVTYAQPKMRFSAVQGKFIGQHSKKIAGLHFNWCFL